MEHRPVYVDEHGIYKLGEVISSTDRRSVKFGEYYLDDQNKYKLTQWPFRGPSIDEFIVVEQEKIYIKFLEG